LGVTVRQARDEIRYRQAQVQRGTRPVLIVGGRVQLAQPSDDILLAGQVA